MRRTRSAPPRHHLRAPKRHAPRNPSYLGRNYVLVGFYLGWPLTALSLALPASRVIILGTEDAFQLLCVKLAEGNLAFKKYITEPLATSLDGRIPAVLFRGGFDLYSTAKYDPLAEACYIAALWCALEPRIRPHRARAAVYRLKCCYLVGSDEGPRAEKAGALAQHVSLVERKRQPAVTDLLLDQRDILALLDTAPAPDFGWNSDRGEFLEICNDLALEMAPKLPRYPENGRKYGQGYERCLAAVRMNYLHAQCKCRLVSSSLESTTTEEIRPLSCAALTWLSAASRHQMRAACFRASSTLDTRLTCSR